mgnify:CR=1 FL=1
MNNRRRLVIVDALWEIKEVGKYVDEILLEYNEHQSLRNKLIEVIIISRLDEFSLMFASRSRKIVTPIPYNLYRYLYSVPTELTARIDKELYRRERHIRDTLGECNVKDIKVEVNKFLMEIEC